MPVADKVYTLKDVSSHDVVLAFAQHLKKEGKMQVPKWVDLAKTGPFKELAPYDEDFYYIRAGEPAGGRALRLSETATRACRGFVRRGEQARGSERNGAAVLGCQRIGGGGRGGAGEGEGGDQKNGRGRGLESGEDPSAWMSSLLAGGLELAAKARTRG